MILPIERQVAAAAAVVLAALTFIKLRRLALLRNKSTPIDLQRAPAVSGDAPLLRVCTPASAASCDATREVICADAMEWFHTLDALPGHVVTGIPDISELTLDSTEYKAWFVDAATVILRLTPADGCTIFVQTDCRIMRGKTHVQEAWLDKSFLCQLAASRVPGCRLLWHKISLISDVGCRKFHKPAYSHVLCFGKADLLLHEKLLTPDVSHRGSLVWSRGTGIGATQMAVDFCRQLGARTIVDPFCGQGTVLAAANCAGLDAVGVEISAKRCRAAQRLQLDESGRVPSPCPSDKGGRAGGAAAEARRPSPPADSSAEGGRLPRGRVSSQADCSHASVSSRAAEVSAYAADVSSPRDRLLASLAVLEAELEELASTAAEGTRPQQNLSAVAPCERFRLVAEEKMRMRLRKCRRLHVCLACGLTPCLCASFAPLPALSHRLWVVMHAEECLKPTNSGKLVLLAHPRARLLVRGIREHDAEYERLICRPSCVALYPGERALSLAQLRQRLSERISQGVDAASETGPANTLDILLLDGTWSQARLLARQLPSSVPMVALQHVHSNFGMVVRDQSAHRAESSRVCTLEAYAQLAAELGDAPDAIQMLHSYLALMIGALPEVKPSVKIAMNGETSLPGTKAREV